MLDKFLNEVSQETILQKEIYYKDIYPSKENIYRIDGVQELANDIEKNGILQPIVLKKNNDDTYNIIIGHRRFAAIKYLIENKNISKFEKIWCNLIPNDESEEKTMLKLHTSNIHTRQLNNYEILTAVREIRKLKENLNIPGKTRQIVSNLIGRKETQVQKYLTILDKADNHDIDLLKKEEITLNDLYAKVNKSDAKQDLIKKTKEEKYLDQLHKMLMYAENKNDIKLADSIELVILNLNEYINVLGVEVE